MFQNVPKNRSYVKEVSLISPTMVEDANGEMVVQLLDVDDFPSQDFNKSMFGFPASDVSLLMRAQTQQEYDMIASRLQEIQVTQPDNEGLSNEQIMENIPSRYRQSVNEILRYVENKTRLELQRESLKPDQPLVEPSQPPIEFSASDVPSNSQ